MTNFYRVREFCQSGKVGTIKIDALLQRVKTYSHRLKAKKIKEQPEEIKEGISNITETCSLSLCELTLKTCKINCKVYLYRLHA